MPKANEDLVLWWWRWCVCVRAHTRTGVSRGAVNVYPGLGVPPACLCGGESVYVDEVLMAPEWAHVFCHPF